MAMRRVALHGRHLLSSPLLFRRHAFLSFSMSTGPVAALDRIRDSGLLRTQGLVGGKWIDSYDGKKIEVQNPATGDVIATVPCMDGKEIADAISSAYSTYSSWSKLTAAEKSKSLRNWYDQIIKHKDELAQLITLEQGKPLKEALGELH